MRALALPLVAAACAPRVPSPRTPPRHAVLVVLDTLRADVFEEVDTPVVDALAADGARARLAWAAGTWTVPSVVSLWTAASVRRHGWDLGTGRLGRYPPLPALPTLAEVLREAGFATSGYHANPYLSEHLGFDRGFDRWVRTVDRRIPEQFAEEVAAEWGDGRRHFAYLHFIGAHSPLDPSPAARARWGLDDAWFAERGGLAIGKAKRGRPEGVREVYPRAYRAVAEDLDGLVGAVLDTLGPHRADTLVVVTADHGELLGEHGLFGHGTLVWEPLCRVPLVVDDPTVPGDEEELPAALSLVDVAPLVTRALGVAHDWPSDPDRPLPLVAQREGWIALSPDGRRKGVWAPPDGFGKRAPARVFDLARDPAEEHPARDPALDEALAHWLAREPEGRVGPDARLDDETRAALEALGYEER